MSGRTAPLEHLVGLVGMMNLDHVLHVALGCQNFARRIVASDSWLQLDVPEALTSRVAANHVGTLWEVVHLSPELHSSWQLLSPLVDALGDFFGAPFGGVLGTAEVKGIDPEDAAAVAGASFMFPSRAASILVSSMNPSFSSSAGRSSGLGWPPDEPDLGISRAESTSFLALVLLTPVPSSQPLGLNVWIR